jgi:hypothetical protein
MIPPTLYGICLTLWWKPIVFSAEYFSWFFNPHVGYADQMAPNVSRLALFFIKQ